MKKSSVIALLVVAGIFLSVLFIGIGFFVGRGTSGWGYFRPFTMKNRNFGYPGYSVSGSNRYMMEGYFSRRTTNVEPFTIEQAKDAVQQYLRDLGNADLEVREIMLFDNHAYVQIVEKSTGIGAMELLVDPTTKAVFPEYGPNMMWNLKYGHMGNGGRMMGGMMGWYQTYDTETYSTMTVTPQEALRLAQNFLDREFPGSEAADDVEAFYGYYTIEILENDEVTGMLSVNGFSGEVFFHSWHGTFIEEYK